MTRRLSTQARTVSQPSSEILEIAPAARSRRPLLVAGIVGISLGIGLIAALTWFSRQGSQTTAPAAATAALSAPAIKQAPDPIAAALVSLRAGKLFAPAGDNAFERYLAARETEPKSVAIQHALLEMTPMVMQGAELALSRNDLAEGERLMQLLERADPKSNNVVLLQERITALATSATNAQQQAIAAAAAAAVAAPPAAREEETPLQPQPAAAELRSTAATAPPVSTAPPESAAPTPAASAAAKPQTATVVPAERRVPSTRAEPPKAADLPQAVLTLIGSIRPNYPRNAMQRRIEGYVDLRFQVGTDGSVSQVTVIAANPKGFFEREATIAMQRARFAPIPVAQQATRRIEFRQQ